MTDDDQDGAERFAERYAGAYARELAEWQSIIAARRAYLLASVEPGPPSGSTLGAIAALAAVEALVWNLQRRGGQP